MNQSMYDALKVEIRDLKQEVEDLTYRLSQLESKHMVFGPPEKNYPPIKGSQQTMDRLNKAAEKNMKIWKNRPPSMPIDGPL